MASVIGERTRLTARFPRRSTRGVILGLGLAQVVLCAVAVAGTLIGFWTGLWVIFGPVVLVSAALIPTWFTGRPFVLWIPYLGRWVWKIVTKQTIYRARPLEPRPVGTLALPGDGARLRVLADPISGAGFVHDPTERTLTAIAAVSATDSFVLAEGSRQDGIAAQFGALLAGFCVDSESGIDRISITMRAVSDSGEAVQHHFDSKGTEEISAEAWEVYNEYLQLSRTRSVRHEAWIAIRLNMTRRHVAQMIRAAGGGVAGGVEVLRERMGTLRNEISDAQVRFDGWCSAEDVSMLARTAYDADAQADLDAHPEVGRSLTGAGPIAVDEAFTYFRTEAGYQRVMWIVDWPRKQTTAGFLQNLVISQVRHTFALLYEPIPTARAIRSARGAATQAETSRMWNAKSGATDTSERVRERQALREEEGALEEGHGAMRFAGLVSVSGQTLEELRSATAQVKTAALRSGCELRVIGGEQASSFIAAALPFGRGL